VKKDAMMLAAIPEKTPARPVVVACRVMEPELERVRQQDSNVEIRYIDQSLHRTPKKMPTLVQEQVDQAAAYATRIVLGYGLCSNGIVGVTARHQGLLVPRCHDCIGLLLGSPAAYKELFQANPGTYYITPGWVAEKKDPLGIVEHEYEPRFGRETAMWAMQEELKHYTHITLIDTGVGDLGSLRQRAWQNACVFKKTYGEIQGSLEYFERLVRGPYSPEYFFHLKPGEQVTLEMFLEDLY
jgi:hypothetical protein